MRRTLQRKYDSILQPGWRAPLTSRRDLLTWACNQTNQKIESLPETKPEHLLPCDNYASILQAFGPDYGRIKAKLGYVRGLYE